MSEKDFFTNYCNFVSSVTSSQASDDVACKQKIEELSQKLNGNFARMDNAVAGIAGEAGEIADLWKKLKFHGKDWNEENRTEMLKELGDMFWYLAQASIALGVSMDDIMNMNVEKITSRHPNGFNSSYMKK